MYAPINHEQSTEEVGTNYLITKVLEPIKDQSQENGYRTTSGEPRTSN